MRLHSDLLFRAAVRVFRMREWRFTIPAGATVWSHGLRDHYESLYEKEEIESVAKGEWAAPPVTFKLPGGAGYASIMEANLRNYAGMALHSTGNRVFRERLGHSHPPGYPYTLRYGEENAKRLAVPAPIEGTITTPWRVVTFGRDLNTLVNSTVVPGLADPHDPSLFPLGARTAWLKHGRAVWRYLDGGENTVAGIKEFSKLAGLLGFEHQVVEGQWQKWTDARAGRRHRILESARSQHLVMASQQHARRPGQTTRAVRADSEGRRGRSEGGFSRPRSKGSHRPLPGHPA